MENKLKVHPYTECEPNKHKQRDNSFGVTWCVKCGRLFTKPSGKPLKEIDKNISMKLQVIKENLCYYHPQNPDFDKENGEKKENCSCDNCFYGRHKMALELLRLHDVIDKKSL